MSVKIDAAAIAALRDRLLETGGAPSLVTGPRALQRRQHPMDGDDEAIVLFEATFESMYLVLASDGDVSGRERITMRGAVRELTSGTLPSSEIDRMTEVVKTRLATEGANARLAAVAASLRPHRFASEAAFVLAAAMAFADDKIADEENELLDSFAELLEIDQGRANELLDQLEDDGA
jgi:tellurite resistance protein